jgi:hypothetical protein
MIPRRSPDSKTMPRFGNETAMGGATVSGIANWLCLAAAPTFAGMALLTGVSGGDRMDMFCAGGHGGSALGGMALMYLLMSAFHLAPWLTLLAGWSRRGPRV